MKWPVQPELECVKEEVLVLPCSGLIGLEERLLREGKRWSIVKVTPDGYEVRVYSINHQETSNAKLSHGPENNPTV